MQQIADWLEKLGMSEYAQDQGKEARDLLTTRAI
jgi:hypothetical protein